MFIDFDTAGDPQLAKMLGLCERFVRDIHAGKEPRYWLSLLGTSGAGKTMLAQAVMRWAARYQERLLDPRNGSNERYSRRTKFLSWSRCCDMMLNREFWWLAEHRSDWLLCLDDIGAEYEGAKALTTSKLYDLLNSRRGLWTIITGNLTVKQIADRLDSRIASRLFRDDSEVIEVEVEDYSVRQFVARQTA